MNNKLYSIILLSYYSSKRINKVYDKLKDRLDKEKIPFELIIMDDGSKDDSYKVALELEKKTDNVFAYQLSKNYTSHYSKFAGFTVCKGACATSIPDDDQMPLDIVVEMYRKWEQGNKIVIPYRSDRDDGASNNLFSNIYYKLMNSISDVEFPKGGADSFLADREIIDIINKRIHPINTSTTVEVLRLGFDPVFIPFVRPKTKGRSRWTMKKKFKLAKDTLLSSSTFPIRMISFIGVCSFLFAMLLMTLAIIVKLTGQNSIGGVSIPGWTSIVAFLSLFSGLLLLSLAVIAEYIWKIYEEVKSRPGYIIKRKGED